MRLRKSFWLIPLLVLSCVFFLDASIPNVPTGTWQNWNAMGDVRSGAAATLLHDGRVLIIGGRNANGPVASADLFGTDGVFSAAAAMQTPRSGHTATVLSDGRVLVTGGATNGGGAVNTAEIYDPSADSWSASVTMVDARVGHTASLLSDGRVLLAGGHDSAGNALSSLEIFDPASGAFSTASAMTSPRMNHAAATLPDGRVLIIGGTADGTNALASTDIYDPSAGTVSAGPALSMPRISATATTTLDGKVAVIGGNNGAASGSQDLATAEIFDPATGQFSPSASNLATARSGHQACLLPKNNAILVLGGSSAGTDLNSAELYYPWADSFQSTGAMSVPRPGLTGSAVGQDGRFLAAGGTGLASTELFGFATVKTDAADYPPGSTVTITGSGWQPGETVTLTLVESPLIDTHGPFTTVADGNGNISDSSFVTDLHDLNITFSLTAVGLASNAQAQATFKDGPKPTSTITFPANNASYNATGWTAGVPIAGTVSFASGTTSRVVDVSIKRNGTTNKYWNGAAFTSSSEVLFAATLNGGQTGWSLSFPASNFPADDSYTVRSQAVDSNGTEPGTTASTFTFDNVVPAAPPAPSLASGSDTGASQSDGITNLTSNLKFSGNAEGNSTVNLFVDGSATATGTGTANNSGVYNNINIPGPFSEGTHTIRATATDPAGNTSLLGATLTITVDTTAPTMGLSPASSTVNTPFSFSWSITDPISGGVASGVNTSTCKVTVDGNQVSTACSGSQSITTAGAHSVVVSATDIAGNTGSDTRTYTVVVDNQAPVVTLTFAAPDGQNGWFLHSPVSSLTLTANDTTTGNSNVTAISCTDGVNPLAVGSLSGIGTPTASGSISVSGEGTHNISCQATDSAGNAGASAGSTVMPVVVKIDTQAPTSTIGLNPAAPNGNNGWYTTNVHLTVSATDNLSGVAETRCALDPGSIPVSFDDLPASCAYSGAGADVTTDGMHVIYAASKDVAANKETPVKSASFQIDKTAPTGVSGAPNRAADHNGWYNHAVDVVFTGTDTISGIDSCTTTTYSGPDGAGRTVNGTCTDKAGNTSAPVASSAFDYDATAPTGVAVSADRSPDAGGYYNHAFTATWTGTDATSGIDSCTSTNYTGPDTNSGSLPGSCTDKAGNTSTPAVNFTFKYDDVAPVSTIGLNPAAPNGNNGWYTTNVHLTVSATDNLSGVAETRCALDPGSIPVSFDDLPASCAYSGAGADVTTDGMHVIYAASKDVAANKETPVKSASFQIDKTAPTIAFVSRTPANGFGWNNTDVTVNWSCSDATSGAVSPSVSLTVSTEGANQSAIGTCTDKAGNTASNTQTGINIDETKPTVTITTPINGATYTLNQAVVAGYGCADQPALSGIDTCVGPVASGSNINTSSVGNKSFTVTATDKAGNTYSQTVNYNVQYNVCLLYDPTRSVKGGATYPLKLYLCDVNSADVSSSGIIVHAVQIFMGTSFAGTPEDAGNANPDSDFRFDATLGPSGGYIFNLQTKGLASGTYGFTFTASNDLTIHTIYPGFGVK